MKIKFAALLAAASLVLAVPVPAEASGAVWLSGHVQNTGWVDAAPSHTVQDGWTVGTTGRGLRLEAVRIWVTDAQ